MPVPILQTTRPSANMSRNCGRVGNNLHKGVHRWFNAIVGSGAVCRSRMRGSTRCASVNRVSQESPAVAPHERMCRPLRAAAHAQSLSVAFQQFKPAVRTACLLGNVMLMLVAVFVRAMFNVSMAHARRRTRRRSQNRKLGDHRTRTWCISRGRSLDR
jgi:hypothetical protein